MKHVGWYVQVSNNNIKPKPLKRNTLEIRDRGSANSARNISVCWPVAFAHTHARVLAPFIIWPGGVSTRACVYSTVASYG